MVTPANADAMDAKKIRSKDKQYFIETASARSSITCKLGGCVGLLPLHSAGAGKSTRLLIFVDWVNLSGQTTCTWRNSTTSFAVEE